MKTNVSETMVVIIFFLNCETTLGKLNSTKNMSNGKIAMISLIWFY